MEQSKKRITTIATLLRSIEYLSISRVKHRETFCYECVKKAIRDKLFREVLSSSIDTELDRCSKCGTRTLNYFSAGGFFTQNEYVELITEGRTITNKDTENEVTYVLV